MSRRHSSRFLVFSLLCVIVITVAVVRFSGAQPLSLELEIAGTGIPEYASTCVVAGHGKHTLPVSFEVGRVNELTMHEAHLYTSVSPGLIVMGFEAVEPVDCLVVLDNEPVRSFNNRVDVVLVNVSGCYEYYHVLEIKERGVISFCFKTDTDTLSSVSLMAVKDAEFTRHRESSAEVNEAVDTARAFLELNGVDAGKYLGHNVEHSAPNYYWHRQFKYANLAHLAYHSILTQCDYVAVRFEHENRGEYDEVWVELGSYQVVGGEAGRWR